MVAEMPIVGTDCLTRAALGMDEERVPDVLPAEIGSDGARAVMAHDAGVPSAKFSFLAALGTRFGYPIPNAGPVLEHLPSCR
jgi:hypothetical protein